MTRIHFNFKPIKSIKHLLVNTVATHSFFEVASQNQMETIKKDKITIVEQAVNVKARAIIIPKEDSIYYIGRKE